MTPWYEVDLSAFAANLRRIRETVTPTAHLLVVKDDAYGHGLEPIVTAAVAEGVSWFGAFDVDTAVAVRDVAGPGAEIIAWTVVDDDDVDTALAHDIVLGLGTHDLIGSVAARCAAVGVAARVHLKIDTGLHRNGVRPEDWAAAVSDALRAERAGALHVEGVWSHIAEASDADDDAAREAFVRGVDAFDGRRMVRHLAASAASFARPEFRFDLVRVGAYAYGIRPSGGPSDAHLGIRPIGTLVAPVVAVHDGVVEIAGGGLDGIDSRLAGRWDVGTPAGARRLREVGAVTSAVSHWPGAAVGDEVTVLGGRAPGSATDAAERLGTIGEEVALRVSPRLQRRYR